MEDTQVSRLDEDHQDLREIYVSNDEKNMEVNSGIEEMETYYEKLKSAIKEILPSSELRSEFNGNFCFKVKVLPAN